jgi:cytochrome c oxidase subunit IV
MSEEKNHITEYTTYVKVYIALLFLTALNITIATYSHSAWVAGFIVLIATIQAAIALNWFMHLQWDNKLIRSLVIFLFLLYIVVILITFLDYSFR